MNETINFIDNRKSVRTYIDKDICRDDKERIIHSAMRAPTAGNMMLYTIIEVEDQDKKDKLAKAKKIMKGKYGLKFRPHQPISSY